jgi:hypothetical protein
MQKTFLAFETPRAVFVKTLMKKIENTPELESIFYHKCVASHEFMSLVATIATKFCNCLTNNFISSVNDKIHAARKRGAKAPSKEDQAALKISRLQSC